MLDLELTNGLNTVTLFASDRAGNVASNSFGYTFTPPTNAPSVEMWWPKDGDQLCGDQFTLLGWSSDATASVRAQVIGGGVTNDATGLVERNGRFWLENVPLAAGTNTIYLTLTDTATNTTTTNIVIVKSPLALTLDSVVDDVLQQPFADLTGIIDASGYKVWVNGVDAEIIGNLWSATGVPINAGGTAVIQVRAIPTSDNGGNGTGGSGGAAATYRNSGNPTSSQAHTLTTPQNLKAKVVCIHYDKTLNDEENADLVPRFGERFENIGWDLGQPGTRYSDQCVGTRLGTSEFAWSVASWGANGQGFDNGNYIKGFEVCGTKVNREPTTYTAPVSWPGEFCEVSGATRYMPHVSDWLIYEQVRGRTALTLFELRTGGKEEPHTESLFVLAGGAEGVGNYFWPEWDSAKQAYPIANTDVALGDLGKLDVDGRFCKMLPEGVTRNVTPTVAGNNYYTYEAPGFGKATFLLTKLTYLTINPSHIKTVKRDADGTDYPTPHFETNETTHAVQSSPVLFVSGATVKTENLFRVKVEGGFPTVNLTVKGTVSGGGASFRFLGALAYSGAATWFVSTTADTPLAANKVDIYKPMQIKWEVAFTAKQEFAKAGENTNHVYVSWHEPTTADLFHTVADVACRNAKDKTTESDIVAGIWGDFTDRSVLKWDGAGPMKYWEIEAKNRMNTGAALDTTPELLAFADGQCGAWAFFLGDVLSVHAIGSQQYAITLTNTYPPTLVTPAGFQVKPSLPGQGGQPLVVDFFDHQVVKQDGLFYDPSYGVRHADPQTWEDASLELLYYGTAPNYFAMPDHKGSPLDTKFAPK